MGSGSGGEPSPDGSARAWLILPLRPRLKNAADVAKPSRRRSSSAETPSRCSSARRISSLIRCACCTISSLPSFRWCMPAFHSLTVHSHSRAHCRLSPAAAIRLPWLVQLIGEGHGDPPRRLLEMAANDQQHTDLVQQLLRSLAPPTSSAIDVPKTSPASDAVSRTSMLGSSACAPAASAFAATAPAAGAPAAPALSGSYDRARARPASAALSAASAPALRERTACKARPFSAAAGGRVPSSAGAPSACAPPAPAPSSGYCVRPSAALSYMHASRAALTTHAEQVCELPLCEQPRVPAKDPHAAGHPPTSACHAP